MIFLIRVDMFSILGNFHKFEIAVHTRITLIFRFFFKKEKKYNTF